MAMTQDNDRRPEPILNVLRALGWTTVAVLLLLPLILRAPWTLFDYVVAAVMLGGAGLLAEIVVRISRNLAYRAGALLAVATIVGLFWVNGAVGFLGDEDNPANLMFAGVIAVAVLGAVVSGFRAAGMAMAMFAAAAAQVLVAVAAVSLRLGSPGYEGLYEAVMGTTLFAAMWLISAALFRKAAHDQRASLAPSQA
jgi:hypothetical protein